MSDHLFFYIGVGRMKAHGVDVFPLMAAYQQGACTFINGLSQAVATASREVL